MRTPLIWILSVGLACALGAGACRRKNDADKKDKAAHTGKPVARLPRIVKLKSQAAQPPKEMFTVRITSVEGPVQTVLRSGGAPVAARADMLLFGGGWVETRDSGKAVVSVREVGDVVLEPGSRLFVPDVGRCGVVMVKGVVSLTGPTRIGRENGCFVHTPGVAVFARKSNAIVAVGRDGSSRVMSIQGQTDLVDVQGAPTLLPAGKAVTIRADGSMAKIEDFEPVQGQAASARLAAFLEKADAQGKKTDFAPGDMIVSAERLANRLDLDVERLAELKTLNKKAMDDKARASVDPMRDQAAVAALQAAILSQSEEMVDLQLKGLLGLYRIVALLQVSSSLSSDKAVIEGKASAVLAKIEVMKKKLPDFFEHAMKRVSSAPPISSPEMRESARNPLL